MFSVFSFLPPINVKLPFLNLLAVLFTAVNSSKWFNSASRMCIRSYMLSRVGGCRGERKYRTLIYWVQFPPCFHKRTSAMMWTEYEWSEAFCVKPRYQVLNLLSLRMSRWSRKTFSFINWEQRHNARFNWCWKYWTYNK